MYWDKRDTHMATPDEIKQKIIDWCKEDNLPCTVGDSPKAWNHFEILVGTIAMYVQKKLPDRVYFQRDYNFDKSQQALFSTLSDVKKKNMEDSLFQTALLYDFDQHLILSDDGKVITGLRLNKFTSTNLSKIKFLHVRLRVEKIGIFINSILSDTVGIEIKIKELEESSDDSKIGIG